jgi:exosortase D (VPLPA-CTERM-specific)
LNKQALLNTKGLAGVALLGLAFWICYHGTLTGLWRVWQTDGDYSYAPVLPLISGWLIWSRRRQIAEAPVSTCWTGGVAVAFLLVVSVYGILGSSPSAVRPAVPLALLAITLFCFGTAVFRPLFFPFFLLIFMIPLPTVVETRIGVPLKIVSTRLGEGLLKSADVSVFVEGNVIDLGVTQLQVVDACSGLRYILPLLALGVIFAYFFEKNRLKQFLIVASTIPIAIFANGFRIGVTGYLAQNYGPEAADGFFHGFSGWLIFVFALALMMGFYSLLRMVKWPSGRPDKLLGYFTKAFNRPVEGNNAAAVIVTVLGLLSVGLLNYATASFEPFRLKSGFSPFPLTIGPWQGRTESIDTEVIELSGAEEALNATFSSNRGEIISLYIGYRGSPFNESENFFHSPNVCLPSAGWKTLSISNHSIEAVPGFGQMVVRKMVIEKMGLRQLVYYWFQTKNRVSSDVHVNRFHLTMHAIGRNNTYDLFIRPITPLKPSESLETAQARLDEFTRQMMEALFEFLSQHQIEGRAS